MMPTKFFSFLALLCFFGAQSVGAQVYSVAVKLPRVGTAECTPGENVLIEGFVKKALSDAGFPDVAASAGRVYDNMKQVDMSAARATANQGARRLLFSCRDSCPQLGSWCYSNCHCNGSTCWRNRNLRERNLKENKDLPAATDDIRVRVEMAATASSRSIRCVDTQHAEVIVTAE
jgi:hypothetical protein